MSSWGRAVQLADHGKNVADMFATFRHYISNVVPLHCLFGVRVNDASTDVGR